MRNFKLLLKTVCIFLAVVLVLSVTFSELYLRGENFTYQDGTARDELAGDVTVLISGASLSLFGIKPLFLNRQLGVSSYSLAGVSMSMRGRYEMLKKELARNSVHTVLMDVSNETLTQSEQVDLEGDLNVLGRLNTASDRAGFFFDAFRPEDYPMVYYDLVSKGIDSAAALIAGEYQTRNPEQELGFNFNRKEDWILPDNYPELYHTQSLSDGIREENVRWLEKIVELCRDNEARLILIMMPQSRYFNCTYDNLSFFHEWYTDFAASHELLYLNFNLHRDKAERLPDAGCYYDEVHLNAVGAERFTVMLSDTLGRIYGYEAYMDDFYADYDEMEKAVRIWE